MKLPSRKSVVRKTDGNPLGWAAKQIAKSINASMGGGVTEKLLPWGQKFYAEHLYNDPSPFHQWLCGKLELWRQVRGQKLCVLAPRGNAKSTWGAMIYPSYCALEGIEPYIIIISDSATQARQHLAAIKEEIEHNELIRKHYPHVAGEGPIWQEGRIRLRNGVMIDAIGKRMKIRGRRKNRHRPTLIILDDPQNDENIESGKQRAKDQSWLDKSVLNAGNDKTNVLMLCTALHRESLAMNTTRNASWRSKVFQSVIKWPLNASLWRQWETIYCNLADEEREEKAWAFYSANKKAMDRGAEVLWEAEENLYRLMVRRLTIGAVAFDVEKQNNCRNPASSEFPDEYFGPWLSIMDWPNAEYFNLRVITVDPSKGKSDKAGDYSAIVKLGRCKDRYLWAECDMERRPVKKIVDDTVAHVIDFQPDAIGVEANQFQELLCDMLISALRERHLGHIPIYPMNNTVKKEVRIRRLGPRLSQRELKLRTGHKGTELLKSQLQDFPTGEHDDGPDALEMGCRLMVDIFNADAQRIMQ